MPYSYIEHTADIGIRAEGATLIEAFEAGAEAALNSIFDLKTICETVGVTFSASAPAADLLFIEVLNELLSVQDRHGLAFKRVRAIKLSARPDGWIFIGEARGEPLNLNRHDIKTEVKGATYAGLRYIEAGGSHTLECILDV